MPARNNKLNWLLLSLAVVVAFIIVLSRPGRRAPQPAPSTNPPATATQAVSTSPAPTTSVPVPAPAVSPIHQAFESARNAPDAQAKRGELETLRAKLHSMPANAAVAAIRQFLDSRTDAPTGQGFKVSGSGLLDEAPTWRTFLLDELARLDPAAAAEYARLVLESRDSSDEWALALRNLARGDTSDAGRALLEQKTRELLRHEPWQREPSVGFLEAFDVAVFVGGTDLLPALSELVRRQDNPAVAHASFLALDRLVINDTATLLAALQAAPDLMEGREQTRANYFARANVLDPEQRRVLESYLTDPRISAAELDAFAGVYPNANFMISHNLLTRPQTPDRAALVTRDAGALRVAEEWLADPRFARQRPVLEKITRRLQEFVRQANP